MNRPSGKPIEMRCRRIVVRRHSAFRRRQGIGGLNDAQVCTAQRRSLRAGQQRHGQSVTDRLQRGLLLGGFFQTLALGKEGRFQYLQVLREPVCRVL